jgi:hypothetical protein
MDQLPAKKEKWSRSIITWVDQKQHLKCIELKCYVSWHLSTDINKTVIMNCQHCGNDVEKDTKQFTRTVIMNCQHCGNDVTLAWLFNICKGLGPWYSSLSWIQFKGKPNDLKTKAFVFKYMPGTVFTDMEDISGLVFNFERKHKTIFQKLWNFVKHLFNFPTI